MPHAEAAGPGACGRRHGGLNRTIAGGQGTL
jgi:hypothetical protein